MTNTRDIIIKLKEVREEKNLSITDIENLLEENNEHLSRSTISRIFADGSEETSLIRTNSAHSNKKLPTNCPCNIIKMMCGFEPTADYKFCICLIQATFSTYSL